jgi:hypothetical protein
MPKQLKSKSCKCKCPKSSRKRDRDSDKIRDDIIQEALKKLKVREERERILRKWATEADK